jgi:hypothetical protein
MLDDLARSIAEDDDGCHTSSVKPLPTGADETDIAHLEARLNVTLPGSYRRFLCVSDGWTDPGYEDPGPLFPVKDLRRFVLDPDQPWVLEAFKFLLASIVQLESVSVNIDPGATAGSILCNALQISEWGEDGVLLLSPNFATPDGEWVCLEYSSESGFEAYPCFEAWFQTRYNEIKEVKDHYALELPPGI